jgi:starch-binding outer membrane protein, SusD/RagB family
MPGRNKFYVWVSLLALLVSGLLSCNLESDDTNPPVDQDELFRRLTAQVYNSLYGYAQTYWLLQELASDELIYLGRSNECLCDLGDLHVHEFDANNSLIYDSWTMLYDGIEDANVKLVQVGIGVDDKVLNPVLADSLRAELRSFRALLYFWLLDAYGDVPIVTEPSTGDFPGNSTRSQVYAFVESELVESIPLLRNEVSIGTYGKINFNTAQSILAKLYLNAEVYTGFAAWTEALTAANQVILSQEYILETGYFENFLTDNSASLENIFVIPYDSEFAKGFQLGKLSLHESSHSTFDLAYEPSNRVTSLASFYDAYEDGDFRKGKSGDQKTNGNFLAGPQFEANGVTPLEDNDFYELNPDPDGINVVFTPEINDLDLTYQQAGVRVGKYEYSGESMADMNNDMVLFRYADILLVKAEALFNISMFNSEALDIVNEIRMRAGVDAFDQLSEEKFLGERGREMFAEGWRRQDLIRFGRYGDATEFKPATEPCRELFPIPQFVLNDNSNLVQNPCY